MILVGGFAPSAVRALRTARYGALSARGFADLTEKPPARSVASCQFPARSIADVVWISHRADMSESHRLKQRFLRIIRQKRIFRAKIVALRSKIRELQIKNGAIPEKMKVAPGCAQDAESRVTLAENGAAPAATTCAEMWLRIVRGQSRKEDIRKLSKSGYAPGVICR